MTLLLFMVYGLLTAFPLLLIHGFILSHIYWGLFYWNLVSRHYIRSHHFNKNHDPVCSLDPRDFLDPSDSLQLYYLDHITSTRHTWTHLIICSMSATIMLHEANPCFLCSSRCTRMFLRLHVADCYSLCPARRKLISYALLGGCLFLVLIEADLYCAARGKSLFLMFREADPHIHYFHKAVSYSLSSA